MSAEPALSNTDNAAIAPPIKRARHAREWLEAYQNGEQGQLALIVVGIKDLSQINDRFGRSLGDLVIQQVGERIAAFVSENVLHAELVARMPGREFLIIVAGTNTAKQLEAGAKKLLHILSGEFGEPSATLEIGPRIGIAIAETGECGSSLLHRAKLALALAYSRKGKRIDFASDEHNVDLHVKNTIDAGLRAAIKKQKITIVFQPQFSVNSGMLIGAEALARLNNKELGEVGALQLFAAADRCDLREELSNLIQRSALEIAANWPVALDTLRLAVNLGAGELDESFSANMLELLKETGFDADRLTLELTEESLVRNIEQASIQLAKLREHKIQIAVDDFGTGYSSLAYLKTLPLDYLKIDKGMTPDINGTGKEIIILRAIIGMAKALDLAIIAEGVEREEELAMLRIEGCDFFQGYLKSPPLNADAFVKFALRCN